MNDLVVKHNALTNASYGLSLVEQRLILLAIVDARRSGQGINTNDPLTIHASSYMQQFNVEKHTAYGALKDAVNSLFNRQLSYVQPYKNTVETVRSRWVSKISYVDNEAMVRLVFAPDVVPLITELERHFTQYAIEQIAGLNSAYAVRLYELLIAWRGAGKTGVIELQELRNRLGVADAEYGEMHNFKRRVLNLALTQINEHTDIKATYQQYKNGRTITGFSFSFSFKKTAKKPTTTQRTYTRADLDETPTLAHPGESYEQALKRLNTRSNKLGTEEEQTEISL